MESTTRPDPAEHETFEGNLVDANEKMGEALVDIGMALGLPRPTAEKHWGSTEIKAKATEMWTEYLHYRALRLALRLLLERGPLAEDTTLTIYGPGDQQLVDQVRHLVTNSNTLPRGITWPIEPDGWDDYVVVPRADGTPPALVLPTGWVMIQESNLGTSRTPHPLFGG